MKLLDVLKIDLLSYATFIENLIPTLTPHPKGIYSSFSIEPIIYDNKEYIVSKDRILLGKDINVKDIFNMIPIIDSSTGIVIPFINKGKGFILSRKPVLPYYGLYKVYLYILRSVNELLTCPLKYRIPVLDIINKIYNNEYTKDTVKEELSKIDDILTIDIYKDSERDYTDYSDLYKSIVNFIPSRDRTCIYNAKLYNYILMLEKYEDYRIHEWELDHGKSE